MLPVVASPFGYMPITFQTAQALVYGTAPTSSSQLPATMLVWGTGGPAASTGGGTASR
ncbi:MAG TPA: hypothetical protein VKZ60_17335 [Chloroflexota bacterium]|nr:hypothetical protein [Chloroflexota bacterium]